MLKRLGNDEIWLLPSDSSVRLWWDQQHYSGRPEETGGWLRGNNERYLRGTCQQSLSVCEEYWLQSSFHQSHGLLWCSDTIPHGTICHQHRPITVCAEGKDTGGRNGHRRSERRAQPMWNTCNNIVEWFQVVTVLMKSTQREQNLCQAASALLATVYLFCGDEVSRQQYKRWDGS